MILQNQLESCLRHDKQTKKIFIGVFARNELPLILQYPCCFIINTHPRNKPGEHWLAFYYNKNQTCYFFDSYGNKHEFYSLENYIMFTSKFLIYNKKRIQGNSTYCGYYCLLFLLFKSRNKEKDFFNYFSNIYSDNDFKIKSLINEFIKI